MDTISSYGNIFWYFFVGIAGSVILLFILSLPFTTQGTDDVVSNFQTKDDSSVDMELGDTRVTTVGVDGKDEVTYETTGSIFQRFFAPNEMDKHELKRVVIETPIDKVVTHGTLKYQYMVCTNGSYRFYNDEQFKDPNVGFTSKSEDFCAKNGQGAKLYLSKTAPSPQRPRCIDVTSYDYNWNNDVLCTNPDGSTYYTSYKGAGW